MPFVITGMWRSPWPGTPSDTRALSLPLCSLPVQPVLHATMDLDKPSMWGSLKQRTRPLLITLAKRKSRKGPNQTSGLGPHHRLDRRLSLSVPDLLDSQALGPPGPYSGPQSASTSVLSSLSTSGIAPPRSLQQSQEELGWDSEMGGGPQAGDTDSEDTGVSFTKDASATSPGFSNVTQLGPSGDEGPEEEEVNFGLALFHF